MFSYYKAQCLGDNQVIFKKVTILSLQTHLCCIVYMSLGKGWQYAVYTCHIKVQDMETHSFTRKSNTLSTFIEKGTVKLT